MNWKSLTSQPPHIIAIAVVVAIVLAAILAVVLKAAVILAWAILKVAFALAIIGGLAWATWWLLKQGQSTNS